MGLICEREKIRGKNVLCIIGDRQYKKRLVVTGVSCEEEYNHQPFTAHHEPLIGI
jgi:hypothetical protein